MIEEKYFADLFNELFDKHPTFSKPNPEQIEIFRRLTERLLEENEKYNLTAIKTPEGVIYKHIFDSLAISRLIEPQANVVDIGTGAGFPALPLAIMRPDLTITAIDSTDKKVIYVARTAELLGIKNLKAICGRAEEIALMPRYRASFDVAVARSVAELPVLTELCVPYLKIGGDFIAMKSKTAECEIRPSESALKKTGVVGSVKIETLYTDQFDENEVRCAFICKKTDETPKELPRRYALIKKKPL